MGTINEGQKRWIRKYAAKNSIPQMVEVLNRLWPGTNVTRQNVYDFCKMHHVKYVSKIEADMYGKMQPCWTCKNAVPNHAYGEKPRGKNEGQEPVGCPWSLRGPDYKGRPVPGWDAKLVKVRYYSGKSGATFTYDSYEIKNCPMYIREELF